MFKQLLFLFPAESLHFVRQFTSLVQITFGLISVKFSRGDFFWLLAKLLDVRGADWRDVWYKHSSFSWLTLVAFQLALPSRSSDVSRSFVL